MRPPPVFVGMDGGAIFRMAVRIRHVNATLMERLGSDSRIPSVIRNIVDERSHGGRGRSCVVACGGGDSPNDGIRQCAGCGRVGPKVRGAVGLCRVLRGTVRFKGNMIAPEAEIAPALLAYGGAEPYVLVLDVWVNQHV